MALAACGGRPDDFGVAAGPTAAAALAAAETVEEDDPQPVFTARVLPASLGLKQPYQALSLQIASSLPSEAEAIAELVAIDETQHTVIQVPLGTIGAGALATLELPVSSIPTPTRALRVAGALSVFVRLRLPADGGAVADADGPEVISYHPEPKGLRLYDAETRLRDFHGGALDAAIVSSVALGTIVTAAYFGPTLPLDWKPPDDGEPDPDHVPSGVEP